MIRFLLGFLAFWTGFLSLVLSVGLLFFVTTPKVDSIKGCLTTQMRGVYLCPKSPNYAPMAKISRYVPMAVIASEDGAFYSHRGFDWFELRASIEKNLEKKEFARGGSTITQQLAKNVFLSEEKSVLRKLREAILTVQMESLLSKNEILEKYLNIVELGPEVYGVQSASAYYFKKLPAELNLAESVFLAFLLPSPIKYSSSFRRGELSSFAKEQMSEIMKRMMRMNKISPEEFALGVSQLNTIFIATPPQPADQTPSKDHDQNESDVEQKSEAAPQ